MITYQVEGWSECFPEAQDLLKRHREEVGVFPGKAELNPDFDSYQKYIEIGGLHIVTARSSGVLIGYHVALIRPHLHYKDILCAFGDIYYIAPEFRQGLVGLRLFKEAEKSWKARGVKASFTGTKKNKDIGILLEHMGWQHSEDSYIKWIGD